MSVFDSLFSILQPRRGFQPNAIPDGETAPPEPTVVRTLVIVYESTMDQASGAKLSRYMGWNSVEELSRGYMSDVRQVSGGLVRYEIDEVWIFNFPHAGFYESIMGGAGAFWCNAPPLVAQPYPPHRRPEKRHPQQLVAVHHEPQPSERISAAGPPIFPAKEAGTCLQLVIIFQA